jgi:mycothiol synthase
MTKRNPEVLVRPASPQDAPLIRDLVNDIDLADLGTADCTAEEILDDLTAPGTDPARDSWLAFDGDRLVAYGVLWNRHGTGRIDVDHYTRPGSLDAGLRIVDLMAARAGEVAAGNGAAEAVVHLHLTPTAPIALDGLAARGWRAIRRHHVLTRPVSVAADPPPEPPTLVAVRTATAAADQRVVHRLIQESFARNFDHQPEDYPHWRARMKADELDWSLIWIATLAAGAGGPTDVGVLLGRNNRETMGWIRDVGVLPAYRGRGIATFLLRTAFAEFARRGRDRVGLGVDTENATGAPRLYQRLGLGLHFAADTWELRRPAG